MKQFIQRVDIVNAYSGIDRDRIFLTYMVPPVIHDVVPSAGISDVVIQIPVAIDAEDPDKIFELFD